MRGQVDRNASASELRSAYRRAVLRAHPDRGGHVAGPLL